MFKIQTTHGDLRMEDGNDIKFCIFIQQYIPFLCGQGFGRIAWLQHSGSKWCRCGESGAHCSIYEIKFGPAMWSRSDGDGRNPYSVTFRLRQKIDMTQASATNRTPRRSNRATNCQQLLTACRMVEISRNETDARMPWTQTCGAHAVAAPGHKPKILQPTIATVTGALFQFTAKFTIRIKSDLDHLQLTMVTTALFVMNLYKITSENKACIRTVYDTVASCGEVLYFRQELLTLTLRVDSV